MPDDSRIQRQVDKLLARRASKRTDAKLVSIGRALFDEERYELLEHAASRAAGTGTGAEEALAELNLRALWKQERFDAMVEHYERLSPAAQDRPALAQRTLRALWKQGRFDAMVERFDRLSAAAREQPALAELGHRALWKQRRLEELVERYERLSPTLQDQPGLAELDLRALSNLERLETLVVHFDRLSATVQEQPILTELTIRALWKLEQARELAERFARLNPALQDLPVLMELNFRALWKEQRLHELLRWSDRLSPALRRQPEYVRFKAHALYRLERLREVIDHLRGFQDIMDADPGLTRTFERSLFKQAGIGPRRAYLQELAQHLERRADRLANDAEAARMYAHSVSAISNDVEAKLSAWQHALKLDPSNEVAADSIRSLDFIAQRMRAERAAEAEWNGGGVQHVAILGMSYCGSTILGAVLGSLAGVENIGESFWLTHRKMPGNPPIVNFSDLQQQQGIQYCATCGPECEVFTATFRQELAGDPTLWYLKIARRIGSTVIVSSDKNYSKLLETDPLLRLDGVILFKSPEQHWWSNLRKIGRTDASFTPIETLEKFMRRWCDDYGQLLHGLEPRGKKLFLCFDEFCRDPDAHLERLAKHLGLPFDGNALRQLSRHQHFIGGNAHVGESYRSGTSPLTVKALPIAPIPEEDGERLRGNEELQEAWQLCMQRHREAFSDLQPASPSAGEP